MPKRTTSRKFFFNTLMVITIATYSIYIINNEKLWTNLYLTLFCPDGSNFDYFNDTQNTYKIYPHHHYKIWFSGNSSLFLPEKNQERLVKFRTQNPNDTMTLVYSRELLSFLATLDLFRFCLFHKIIPLNFDTIHKMSDREEKLKALALEEIRNHKSGGNLAAGSDIARVLPIKFLGNSKPIYSDFDIEIDTIGVQNVVPINAPIIKNIKPDYGSMLPITKKRQSSDFKHILVNNDLLYIADFKAEEIFSIQDLIIKSYEEIMYYYYSYLNDRLKKLLHFQNPKYKLFDFRKVLELVIQETDSIMIQRLYINTVTNVTGPNILLSFLRKKCETYASAVNFSIWEYEAFKNAFLPEKQQDSSWIPKKHLK